MIIKKDFCDLNKLKSNDMAHSKVVEREVLYRTVYNNKISRTNIVMKTRLKSTQV